MSKNVRREYFKNDTIRCEWIDTRYGFKHEATCLKTGIKVKVCYYNRTWERFEFDTVMNKLAEKTGDTSISEFVSNRNSDSKTDALNSLSALASLAGLMCDTEKDSNETKKRILKAGLGEAVSFPDDFDSLPEDVKTARLDGALKMLKK